MDPSFVDMEAKRQAMIASFQEVAQAMTKCANLVNDFARLSPATLGVSFPTISVSSIPPVPTAGAAVAGAQTKKPLGRPRKGTTAPVDSSAIPGVAPAAAAPTSPSAVVGNKRGRKPTKEKKPKDINAPKRPPSAYLLFQNDVREEIQLAHPDIPYKDRLGIIAAKWKGLGEEERKEYEEAYKLASDEYKVQDDVYKTGPQAAAFAAQQYALAHPAAAVAQGQGQLSSSAASDSSSDSAASDSSSDSSSEDDSSDDDEALPTKAGAPTAAAAAQQAPKGSLGAAIAAVGNGDGDKKSKKKVDGAGEPEKKKKKSKANEA